MLLYENFNGFSFWTTVIGKNSLHLFQWAYEPNFLTKGPRKTSIRKFQEQNAEENLRVYFTTLEVDLDMCKGPLCIKKIN
jgi:hypothetical protein